MSVRTEASSRVANVNSRLKQVLQVGLEVNAVQTDAKRRIVHAGECPPHPFEDEVDGPKIRGKSGAFSTTEPESPRAPPETATSPTRTTTEMTLYHWTTEFPDVSNDTELAFSDGPVWTSTYKYWFWPGMKGEATKLVKIIVGANTDVFISPKGHSMAYKCSTNDGGDGHHNDVVIHAASFDVVGKIQFSTVDIMNIIKLHLYDRMSMFPLTRERQLGYDLNRDLLDNYTKVNWPQTFSDYVQHDYASNSTVVSFQTLGVHKVALFDYFVKMIGVSSPITLLFGDQISWGVVDSQALTLRILHDKLHSPGYSLRYKSAL